MSQSTLGSTQVLYVKGARSIITVLHEKTGRCPYTGETVTEIQKRSPGAVLMTLDESIALIESICITEPEPITMDQYEDAFDALPPINWKSSGDVTVFQFEERTNGRVTGTYARLHGRAYAWQDIAYLPVSELAAKAAAVDARLSAASASVAANEERPAAAAPRMG